jgi:hypothetical protein
MAMNIGLTVEMQQFLVHITEEIKKETMQNLLNVTSYLHLCSQITRASSSS